MERKRKDQLPLAGRDAEERREGPEAAFDLWLEDRLHQLYDSVAQEPIPPELLELIEADRTRRSG